MKKIMFLGLILCAGLSAPAQTWEEWFRQKETQKKYLLEQIAALKVYGDYAKKGYAIAAKGWRTIQGIKEGDLSGHSEFFSSLSQVNPQVIASPFVGGIITLGSRTVAKVKEIKNLLRTTQQLTSSEIKFFSEVLDGLSQESADALYQLGWLTTSGGLELSDDERLQRLHRLYEGVQELYTSTCSLGADIQLLTAQRLRQLLEIHHLKKTSGGK
jgi:hypothetical protein